MNTYEQTIAYDHYIQNSVKIYMKHIPDCSKPARMDPRVYAQQSKEQALRKQTVLSLEPSVAEQRASMGFDNLDITTVPITTVLFSKPQTPCSMELYYPEASREKQKNAMIFIHGGGFIGGTTKVVANYCKYVAQEADCAVFNLDYRLAPEAPYPAAVDDCWNCVQWIHNNAAMLHIDPRKLLISGDSAGGNLSAVCALKDRDNHTAFLAAQMLLYPCVTLSSKPLEDYHFSLNDYAYDDSQADIIIPCITFIANATGSDRPNSLPNVYVQHQADVETPYISPLCSDDLAGVCKTILVTAEYDFLTVQVKSYARKLTHHQVDVTYIEYKGMDHAFIDKMGIYPQAADCAEIAAQIIREL